MTLRFFMKMIFYYVYDQYTDIFMLSVLSLASLLLSRVSESS
jgi:hypothetical protein